VAVIGAWIVAKSVEDVSMVGLSEGLSGEEESEAAEVACFGAAWKRMNRARAPRSGKIRRNNLDFCVTRATRGRGMAVNG